ncbi:TetR/AcrR family transcriptional regulator [Lacticaseibacillus camelliae]|uniref:TetR family transcriptional regulator n=1 Tax=Lacticaseibacillus camelliae DSM 22697 = JCM 13995 TaxID=1423730 RepID=A0A0R2FMX7_9LACO|nr:TetR/AcrR family transcriptional regulator [Lacticaseibacillus camelliae]KRN25620.1 TetR family transcriptional regulator [Lacticaseibacillus camelliae DSM 22697 = JCM 13995]
MADLTISDYAQVFGNLTPKQRKILESAIEVFAEKGYANASTHEIAKRAGVAEGNIFARFGSKRGLLNAIIQPVAHRIFPVAVSDLVDRELASPFQTRHDFCESLIRRRLQMLRDNAALVKVFITELLNQATVRQQLVAQLPEAYWEALDEALDRLRANGELVAWSNHTVLKYLWSLVGGVAASFLYFNQPLTDETINNTITAAEKVLAP